MPTDPELLRMALAGYSAELQNIVERITDLRRQLGIVRGRPPKNADVEDETKPVQKRRKRLKMSAAGRKRIGDATRARWAAARAAKQSTLKKTTTKKRKKLSAADRAKISGGQAKTKKKSGLPS